MLAAVAVWQKLWPELKQLEFGDVGASSGAPVSVAFVVAATEHWTRLETLRIPVSARDRSALPTLIVRASMLPCIP